MKTTESHAYSRVRPRGIAVLVAIVPFTSAFLNSAPSKSPSSLFFRKNRLYYSNSGAVAGGRLVDPDVLLRTEYSRNVADVDYYNNIASIESAFNLPSTATAGEYWMEEPQETEAKVNSLLLDTKKEKAKRGHHASRVSTMPGMGRSGANSLYYKDDGSKNNAMYRGSDSVPESMMQFAGEIHQIERISRAQEIELGTKTQEAIRLQTLYDNLYDSLNREPTDEEWCAAAGKINMETIRQTIEEGLEAKNRLVTSNLRMVQSVVNTYIRNGLTAQYNAGDMMQDGIIALIRAAEKFEPDRGWKFSTYAMYWVRASVKRSQVNQSRVITVPQRQHENYKRLLKVERDLMVKLGRRPTLEEMGAEIGMSKLQVERCMTAMEQRCLSLDQELFNSKKPSSGSDSQSTLIDIVGAKVVDEDVKRETSMQVRRDLIAALHRHLAPEEVDVLLLRYGLKDGDGITSKIGSDQLTIAELSRQLGLKPDKVRRMILKSLNKLKKAGEEEWTVFEQELQ